MPFVSPGSVSAGNVAPASWGNGVVAYLLNLANPPACRVYHNTTQSLADSTFTVLAFNSERFDTDGMHDTVTNNSRITAKTAGLYMVGFTFDVAAAGDYSAVTASFLVNGTTSISWAAEYPNTRSDNQRLVAQTLWKFAVNDYVEVRAFQDNTANTARNVSASASSSPEFWAVWVGLG